MISGKYFYDPPFPQFRNSGHRSEEYVLILLNVRYMSRFVFTMDGPPSRNFMESVGRKMFYILDAPVTWFRENVVVPNRTPIKYYHEKYRRVPTIDECYELDALCMYEANEQFKRDWKVDAQIMSLLRERKIECFAYEGPDAPVHCKKVIDDYDEAELNFFIKYGDLGAIGHVKQAYMKQKHRMVYERRKAEGKLECPVVFNTE